MLVELRLENYAVIDHVAVEFAPGLNLLTGETGAGKSILIDALALLLGEKASTDVVRTGADRAVVSAGFEVEGAADKAVAKVLEENGIEAEAGSIILRREIATGGKGRVFVNNQPATVGVLKQLSKQLVTVHAQNESLLSFDAAARLSLLDSFAGIDVTEIADVFAGWRGIRGRILEIESDEQDRLRLLDVWRFQQRKIGDARFRPAKTSGSKAKKSPGQRRKD